MCLSLFVICIANDSENSSGTLYFHALMTQNTLAWKLVEFLIFCGYLMWEDLKLAELEPGCAGRGEIDQVINEWYPQ